MSLLRPVADKYGISQPFGGHFRWETPGYLQSDAHGARKGMKRYFAGATKFTDLHLGVDYLCPTGTPVYAVESGKVVAQGTYWETGEHYLIFLIHKGDYTVVTFDTHLSKLLVPTGHNVKKGSVLALSGASGNVTGPHLHHEFRVTAGAGNPADSGSWMRWEPKRFEAGGLMASSLYAVPNVYTG